MHNAIFISDLHLCPSRPSITNTFLTFLNQCARNTQSLYILGDFFEQWPGDDCSDSMSITVIEALKTFTQTSKIPTFFIHGNRDFLISKTFCQQTGVTLLPDPSVITIGEQRILLSHGDYLCIDDKPYQRLRKITSNRLAKKIFMLLPQRSRKKIWQKSRNKSKRIKASDAAYLGDINIPFTINECQRHHCNALIHGHTHRPTKDTLDSDNRLQRITLPCWDDNAGYATVNLDGIQLHYFNTSTNHKPAGHTE